ncbi:hypothetical protein IMG5_105660 [Ichthyophthirius multifiliis]|uniref:Cilia- and flagella-associated protein 58 central coiled coil domain-containing protein n=1 Tax=Ichthyophthirius multifiliis TaxID=5932 RepID=G0QT27_ICHMU|nr:hypothetical protein IMG5_105660 [Ichthyophthirius multifiliis]EGR31626.1 hypothetical protein IMG5_105660 [Ichthyophthirius multifiliis]|eukprot:XP_004035112.1 hypothetical protein IMG5_105660 [Ichthyophthirius multifiliis]
MSFQQDQQINSLQGNLAFKILAALLKSEKINIEQHDIYKQKFENLHNLISNSFKNQKQYPVILKKVQANIICAKEQLEIQSHAQDLVQDKLKNTQIQCKIHEQEEECLKKSLDQQNNELNKIQAILLEKVFLQINIKYQQKQRKVIYKKMKKIQDLKRKSQKIIQSNNQKNQKMKFLKKQAVLKMKKNIQMNKKIKLLKYEPIRLQKKQDIIASAIRLMQKDLEQFQEDIQKINKQILEQQQEIQNLNFKEGEINTKNIDELTFIQQEKLTIKQFKDEIKRLKTKIEIQQSLSYTNQIELDQQKRENQRIQDLDVTLRKQIELIKYEYKLEEKLIKLIKDKIYEIEISIDKIQRLKQQINCEITQLQDNQENIGIGNKLIQYKVIQIRKLFTDKNQQKAYIEQQIRELETQFQTQRQLEQFTLKKIKNLTNLRESMSRKASQACFEVRQSREELKMLELTIINLSKRYQEEQIQLNGIKELYEEAKKSRNTFVIMIQNSFQNLAELKERIKITQNEIEILKNEALEKEQSKVQFEISLKVQINLRDRQNFQLNRFQYKRKTSRQFVDQNVSEIEKLNMIFQGLDMQIKSVTRKFELCQQARNYLGIQLIDRNDELCIFYEKSNIFEKIIINGENLIKQQEDDIRMININIQEKQRQVYLVQKQIQTVPVLAQQIMQYKLDLNQNKKYYFELSQKLENPENVERWRDLGGQDLDDEQLEAKIQILDERLNKKKEQIIEKDLVLEEITNISNELRDQLVNNRQNTLETSEKLNNYEIKMKKITRQMMSTIAELSVYQATIVKLLKEREDLAKIVNEAIEKENNKEPPTIECELEYQKILRSQLKYHEERKIRLEKNEIEKQIPPFVTKTTAQHRYVSYIDSQDDVGLPKSYGQYAPFKPSVIINANMYYKKPIIKDVVI